MYTAALDKLTLFVKVTVPVPAEPMELMVRVLVAVFSEFAKAVVSTEEPVADVMMLFRTGIFVT